MYRRVSPYPYDAYGDPRDYALEARQILNGELALSPGLEHCLALLKDILQQEVPREAGDRA